MLCTHSIGAQRSAARGAREKDMDARESCERVCGGGAGAASVEQRLERAEEAAARRKEGPADERGGPRHQRAGGCAVGGESLRV